MEDRVRLTINCSNIEVKKWLETQGNRGQSIIKLILDDIKQNGAIVNHTPSERLMLQVTIASIVCNGVTSTKDITEECAKICKEDIDTKFRRRCLRALQGLQKEGIIFQSVKSTWEMTTLGEMVYGDMELIS